MRRLALAVLPFTVAVLACQPQAGPLSQDDVAAIREVLEEHRQAVLAGNLDAVAAGYTDNAIQMPPNAPIVQGRENIRTWFQGFPELTEYSIDIQEIVGRGDVAYLRGAYTLSAGAGSETTSDTGKNLVIYRKQVDGSWLVSIGIWNSDLPLPPAEGEHSEGGEHR